MRTSLDAALTEKGIAFVDQDAGARRRPRRIRSALAIASGTNLLVVNICETRADGIAQNVVDSAKTAGIPLLFFNRSFPPTWSRATTSACSWGTNYEEAGIMQGKMNRQLPAGQLRQG